MGEPRALGMRLNPSACSLARSYREASRPRLSKLFRGFVSQTAVRTLLVVLLPPCHPILRRASKGSEIPFVFSSPNTLLAAVRETLDARVPRRHLHRLYVQDSFLPLHTTTPVINAGSSRSGFRCRSGSIVAITAHSRSATSTTNLYSPNSSWQSPRLHFQDDRQLWATV